MAIWDVFDEFGNKIGKIEETPEGIGCFGGCLIGCLAMIMLGALMLGAFIDAIVILPQMIFFYLQDTITYFLFGLMSVFNVFLLSKGYKIVKICLLETLILIIPMYIYNRGSDNPFFSGDTGFIDFCTCMVSSLLISLVFCIVCSLLSRWIATQLKLIDSKDDYHDGQDFSENIDWFV